MFVESLNSALQILFVHMIALGKSFSEMTNFVKKVNGVRKARQMATGRPQSGDCYFKIQDVMNSFIIFAHFVSGLMLLLLNY